MGEFGFGGLKGSPSTIVEAYTRLRGPDTITAEELERRRNYMLGVELLPPAALGDRLKRLVKDDLPHRESELGGAQSGVQWEYAVLVEAIGEAIRANKLSRADLREQVGEAWELVKTSFEY